MDICQIWRLENVDLDVIVVLIYYLYFVGVSSKVKARFIINNKIILISLKSPPFSQQNQSNPVFA